MPRPVLFSPLARRDFMAIGRYIAKNDIAAADRLLARLTERCRKLGVSGPSHRLRPELGANLRAVTFERYFIVFTVLDQHVRIERIVHGARHLGEALKDESP